MPRSVQLLSRHDVLATFAGIQPSPMAGMQRDTGGTVHEWARFDVTEYVEYEKPGQYGDAQKDKFMCELPKQSPEIRRIVETLQPGHNIRLAWNHNYVTENGASFPERTIVRIDRLVGGVSPAWLGGGTEPPAGERNMGSYTMAVYTTEQQERLGVNQMGEKAKGIFKLDVPSGGLQAVGPAWTRGDMEAPAGEKDMGGWVATAYTPEQQARLGVDEQGNNVPVAVPAAPTAVLQLSGRTYTLRELSEVELGSPLPVFIVGVTTKEQVDSVLSLVASVGGNVLNQYSLTPMFTAQLGDQRGIEALLSHPAVKYVEADGVCSVSAKGAGGGGEKFKLF